MPKIDARNTDDLDRARTHTLAKALEYSIEWLGVDKIKSKYPETKWIDAFSKKELITPSLMKENKIAWNIQYVRDEEYPDIARQIQKCIDTRSNEACLGGDSNSAVFRNVTQLAKDIQSTGTRPRIRLSWASKILLHMWPECSVFVWDSNALLSINARMRLDIRDGPVSGYGYWNFMEDCKYDFNRIKTSAQFEVCLEYLIGQRHSVLRDSCARFAGYSEKEYDKLIRDFLSRRLYDKFLWCEGEFIKKKLV